VTHQEAYVKGLEDGIRAYAWMKDGVTYVGTTGRTLAQALENARTGVYPPQPNLARMDVVPAEDAATL
jgi:predicted transcriptional regulator